MGTADRPRVPFPAPPLRCVLMKAFGLSCLTAWMKASLANAPRCPTPTPTEAFRKGQKEGEEEST